MTAKCLGSDQGPRISSLVWLDRASWAIRTRRSKVVSFFGRPHSGADLYSMGCASSQAVAVRAQPQVQFFDKYGLGDVLGRGAYGTVRRAYDLESNDDLAVKILDLHRDKSQPKRPRSRDIRKAVSQEQSAWAHVGRHPNVVGLREAFADYHFAYFVMELCVCSLFTAWTNEPDLNEHTYARYFKQMAQSLAHIHSVGVVHRDVKQDNFMVGGPDGRTVKLCDFGLSAVMDGESGLRGQYGTAPYMAPEMVTDTSTHGPPADMWSLGVIVYVAFFGRWPYQPREQTKEEMAKAIREGIVPPKFAPRRKFLQNAVSEEGIRFVKGLLDRDPLTRTTGSSCMQMAYLKEECCDQLQVSLVPQLNAAVNWGAFNVKTPTVETCQEWHVMRMQSAAQLRRESRTSTRSSASMSTTCISNITGGESDSFTPVAIGHPMP